MHQQTYDTATATTTTVPHQNGIPGFAHINPPSQYAQFGHAPQNSSATAYRPQFAENRLNTNAMEHYWRERNDFGIVILHPKVAEKTYGTVKRYFCPPPCIYLIGNGWQYRHEEMLRKGESVQGAQLSMFIGIENSDQDMQQLSFNYSKKCFIAETLYISSSEKRRHITLSMKIFYGNGHCVGQFNSKSIKLTSKPTNENPTKNAEMCIASGTTVALFHSTKKERGGFWTRYLHINNGNFYGSSTAWSAFKILLLSDDKPKEFQSGHVHYGATVKLVCSVTGMDTPRLVIRKVYRNVVQLEDDGPVLNFQKCAFYVKDTERLYLCLSHMKINQFQAVPFPYEPNKETIIDTACWSIMGTDIADYQINGGMGPVRSPLTPMPIVNLLNFNGSNGTMLEFASSYIRPQFQERLGNVVAETISSCPETLLRLPPDVSELRGEWPWHEQFQSSRAINLGMTNMKVLTDRTQVAHGYRDASEEECAPHAESPFQQLPNPPINNNRNSEEQLNPPLMYAKRNDKPNVPFNQDEEPPMLEHQADSSTEKRNVSFQHVQFQTSRAISLGMTNMKVLTERTQVAHRYRNASEEECTSHAESPFGVQEHQQLANQQINNNRNSEAELNPPLIYAEHNDEQNVQFNQDPSEKACLSVVEFASINKECEELPILEHQTDSSTGKINVSLQQKKKKKRRCGKCIGCQKEDNCGDCAPCRNDKSHRVCNKRICENLVNAETQQSKLICKICNIHCHNKESFENHVKIHTENKFKCKICQIPLTESALAEHEIRYHRNRNALEKEFIFIDELPCIEERQQANKTFQKSEEQLDPTPIYTECNIEQDVPFNLDPSGDDCVSSMELPSHNEECEEITISKYETVCSTFYEENSNLFEEHEQFQSSRVINLGITNMKVPTDRTQIAHRYRNASEKECTSHVESPFGVKEHQQLANRQINNYRNSEEQLSPPLIYAKRNDEQNVPFNQHPSEKTRLSVVKFASVNKECKELPRLEHQPDSLTEKRNPSVQKKKKRQRCGKCSGCQKKDNCGDCAPCKNDKCHQVCHKRICENLVKVAYKCDKCSESFTRKFYLQLHKKSHINCQGNVTNVPSKKFIDKIDLENHSKTDKFECLVGKKYPTLSDLNSHINKHNVYEECVDPVNVNLSNWSAEMPREILKNQPTVVVENLDINSINLKLLANFGKPIENLIDGGNLLNNDISHIVDNSGYYRYESEGDCISGMELPSAIKQLEEFTNFHVNKLRNSVEQRCRPPSDANSNIEQSNQFDRVPSEDDGISRMDISSDNEFSISDPNSTSPPSYANSNIEQSIQSDRVPSEGDGVSRNVISSDPKSTTFNVDENNLSEKTVKKKKRCGECNGCQNEYNCGNCGSCRNDKSNNICKQRRCEKLKYVIRGLKCKTCGSNCYTYKRLERHMKTHTEGKLKCKICQIRITEPSLELHKNSHHGGLQLKGDILDVTSVKCNTSEKRDTLDVTSVKCNTSEKQDTLDETSVKRNNISEKRDTLDVTSVKCNTSESNSHGTQRLERPIKIHFEDIFKCKICQIPYTKTSLSKHMKSCHPDVQLEERILKKQIFAEKPVTRNRHFRLHKNSHKDRQYSCNICGKIFSSEFDLENHTKTHCIECYVCKKHFSTLSDLNSHINKHIVYEQWVDPLSVYLSNWSPEKSREILENQPLVMVEKLDIKNINLKLTDFRRSNGVENIDKDMIDLSSESDSDVEILCNILERYECYFCDKKFRKLNDLGVHIKTCSLRANWKAVRS